jgi:hypothetical protein
MVTHASRVQAGLDVCDRFCAQETVSARRTIADGVDVIIPFHRHVVTPGAQRAAEVRRERLIQSVSDAPGSLREGDVHLTGTGSRGASPNVIPSRRSMPYAMSGKTRRPSTAILADQPYATSHEALDRDEAAQQEARNVAPMISSSFPA